MPSLQYKLTVGTFRIKTRLRDEGCGKELEALDVYSFECLRKLPAVHRPNKLTDRGTRFLPHIAVSSFLTLGQRGTVSEMTWSNTCSIAIPNS